MGSIFVITNVVAHALGPTIAVNVRSHADIHPSVDGSRSWSEVIIPSGQVGEGGIAVIKPLPGLCKKNRASRPPQGWVDRELFELKSGRG